MRWIAGSVARKLDFGDVVTPRPSGLQRSHVRPRQGLPPRGDKYKELEHRRRQAQISARRMLDLLAKSIGDER